VADRSTQQPAAGARTRQPITHVSRAGWASPSDDVRFPPTRAPPMPAWNRRPVAPVRWLRGVGSHLWFSSQLRHQERAEADVSGSRSNAPDPTRAPSTTVPACPRSLSSHHTLGRTRREHLNVLRILGTMKAAGVPSSYVHVRRHTIRRFRGANRAARTIFGSRLFRRSTTRATHTHGWSNLELRLIPSRGRPCCVHNYGQTCCQIGLAAMIDRASRASG
jgi:hypothetical protein